MKIIETYDLVSAKPHQVEYARILLARAGRIKQVGGWKWGAA